MGPITTHGGPSALSSPDVGHSRTNVTVRFYQTGGVGRHATREGFLSVWTDRVGKGRQKRAGEELGEEGRPFSSEVRGKREMHYSLQYRDMNDTNGLLPTSH